MNYTLNPLPTDIKFDSSNTVKIGDTNDKYNDTSKYQYNVQINEIPETLVTGAKCILSNRGYLLLKVSDTQARLYNLFDTNDTGDYSIDKKDLVNAAETTRSKKLCYDANGNVIPVKIGIRGTETVYSVDCDALLVGNSQILSVSDDGFFYVPSSASSIAPLIYYKPQLQCKCTKATGDLIFKIYNSTVVDSGKVYAFSITKANEWTNPAMTISREISQNAAYVLMTSATLTDCVLEVL